MKCTDCSNLLTPWRGALQGTLAYQCRGWWRSSGTHQSEPHWFATRHFLSWASISSWKASLKPDCGSSLCLSDRAWNNCHACVLYKTLMTIRSGKYTTSNKAKDYIYIDYHDYTFDVYLYIFAAPWNDIKLNNSNYTITTTLWVVINLNELIIITTFKSCNKSSFCVHPLISISWYTHTLKDLTHAVLT